MNTNVAQARKHQGAVSFHAGLAAEARIAQDYEHRGFVVCTKRWRGKAGEIDLIVADAERVIFVEVKQSRNFERAAQRITPNQMRRICRSAEEYLATQPRGSLTEVRFDVALVNGHGESQIIENAFGHG